MITTEIKVNGITIGYLQVNNKGKHPKATDHFIYRFQYWRPGETNVSSGTVLHIPDDGAEVLVSKVLHLVRPFAERNSNG